ISYGPWKTRSEHQKHVEHDTNIGSSKQTLLNYKKCLKVDIPLYEFNELGKTEASSTKNLTNFIESLYL
ncbi:3240_t:CDS:2, partial [Entrophospora sp. SA101]